MGISDAGIAFSTQLFGFSKAEVLQYIASLQRECEETRRWANSLTDELNQRRISQAAQRAEAPPTQPMAPSMPQQADVAHLIERTLTSAHRVADDIRRAAEREAGRKAEQIVAEARNQVARIIEDGDVNLAQRQAAAVARLHELTVQIDGMKARQRELRISLEQMVTMLTERLAEIRAQSAAADGQLQSARELAS